MKLDFTRLSEDSLDMSSDVDIQSKVGIILENNVESISVSLSQNSMYMSENTDASSVVSTQMETNLELISAALQSNDSTFLDESSVESIGLSTHIPKTCANCKRNNNIYGNIYEVIFHSYERCQLKQRRKFRNVTCSRSSREEVTLCFECSNYLTKDKGDTYENMWPSFVFYFLSDENIEEVYGHEKWKYIPEKWRYWWSDYFSHITIESLPKSLFNDISEDQIKFQKLRDSDLLSEIAKGCDEFIIPNVLCPWGCSEYIHKVGEFPIDLLIQRYTNDMNIILIHSVERCKYFFSTREDFIRTDQYCYDNILLNPKWIVLPSMFIKPNNKGVFCATCCNHNSGTLKKYLHVPRNPFRHNLPSNNSDQLCHAVIRPRSISGLKASKYSNAYQMHEQRGCFQGIDTCSIQKYGDFSYKEPILEENEALSLNQRDDLKELLSILEENKVLPVDKGYEMILDAEEKIKECEDNIQKCTHGSTYISIEDAIKLQNQINVNNNIMIEVKKPNVTISTKRNWMTDIIYCHMYDERGFGAQFPLMSSFVSHTFDFRYLWILCRSMISIKKLWEVIEREKKSIYCWSGWILTYLSKECFKEVNIRTSILCPFKSSHVSTHEKLLDKLSEIDVCINCIEDIGNLLGQIGGLKVIHLRDLFKKTLNIELTEEIIYVLGDNIHNTNVVFGEEISTNFLKKRLMKEKYKLVYISLSWRLSERTNDWDSVSYMRHNDQYFSSWWMVKRNGVLPIKVDVLPTSINISNFNIVIYSKESQSNLSDIRKHFMKSIGGQSHVYCVKHNIPLIIAKKNDKKCLKSFDSNINCKHNIQYMCPKPDCNLGICHNCFKSYPKDKEVYLEQFDVSYEDSDYIPDMEKSIGSKDSLNDSIDDDSLYFCYDEVNESDIMNKDTCFDELVISREEYIDNDIFDSNEDNYIPSTNAGEQCMHVVNDTNQEYIDGHVILNQCGSLLSRNDNHVNSFRSQKHFLQRIVSTVRNTSIPLIFPEAMLFPSIFWKLLDKTGSILGALPCSLLSSSSSVYGFASIKNHINVRLTSQFSSSSTNPTYISFQYDMLSNLLLNSVDSRLIIARGLTCTDGNVGLKLKSSKETSLHDSIDSKQIVKNLCASQKYLPMHFFLTFTVNQSDHFGVKNIKQWIDDKEWLEKFTRNGELTEQNIKMLKKSIEQAAAPLLLRNWMETRTILLEYIYNSPKSPYHPVQAIFSRDEYQKDKGNLPHIHLILSVLMEKLTLKDKTRIDNLIRASICSIRTGDEIQDLIDEGVIDNWEDLDSLKTLGKKILSHKCDQRCLRRIGDGDGPENFKCRKLNNYLVSPDHTKDSYISIETVQSKECIDQLVKIGMAKPIVLNKFGVPSTFESTHSYFHPKRHIPPTNPNEEYNISPVEGYTFSICKSMQNIQSLTHTNGLNRYVCKYVGKIDDQNQIIVRAHPYDNGTLISNYTFLHNTKIVSSAINEDKALNKKRTKHHPKGRSISIMEMLQIMMSYPQVKTDMVFEVIATVPLEQRRGVEVNPTNNHSTMYHVNEETDENSSDGIDISIPINKARLECGLASWRQLRNHEIITLEGVMSSNVSIDKITKFSLRPPEIRNIVTELGNYYRWFHVSKKKIPFKEISSLLNKDIRKSVWLDDLQKLVKLRSKAIPELIMSLQNKQDNNKFENNSGFCEMFDWIREINILKEKKEEDMTSVDQRLLCFVNKFLLFENEDRHLPIPVYSYIKPTMGTRFILHILLSMGHFETELDLLLHKNLRDALRYAKLIGDSNDENDLQIYSNALSKKFIEEQLVYFPNGSKVISNWVIIVGELFDNIIVRNEIPITDMPPILQTQLECIQLEKVHKEIQKMKKSIIEASYRELEHVVDYLNLPKKNELLHATVEYPMNWKLVKSYKKTPYQSISSFEEQKNALSLGVDTIDKYCMGYVQNTFTKCLIIAGSPGTGKTFLEIILLMYAISKGLKCCITAIMSKRAIQLGGIHIHKLFCLPGHNKFTLHRLAEIALISLQLKIERFRFLQLLNVIFIDEIGQVSSELVSTLDIILRKLRNNDIFFGGLLIISTIDYKQLAPIKGKPFLTSPHILSCFVGYELKSSVRANDDENLERIQNISRMPPSSYKNNPGLLQEFKKLLKETCTFVPTWNSPLITPEVHRIYGKKRPAKQAADEYIQQVKQQLQSGTYIECESKDVELTYNSHEEWHPACDATRKALSHHVKEPQTLLFFKGATYLFTYNAEGKFSQSQVGLLFDLPSKYDTLLFKKIPILVAPPGVKCVTFDSEKNKAFYINQGWQMHYVCTAPERTISVQANLKGQRKQYGLKPHVTSTVHSSMGDTLDSIATEISTHDANFRLWDKAQIIVLLSRTKFAKDIIFVGDVSNTIKAICNLIQMHSQWEEYMETVLSLVCINNNPVSLIHFNYRHYPFEIKDVPLPVCNTGFVYMLISTKDHDKNYIGQTFKLGQRLYQHNSGFGAIFTSDVKFRPWFLFSYVCGFNNNRRFMFLFESKWQQKRNRMVNRGIHGPKELALLAQDVIDEMKNFGSDNLRAIHLFK